MLDIDDEGGSPRNDNGDVECSVPADSPDNGKHIYIHRVQKKRSQ